MDRSRRSFVSLAGAGALAFGGLSRVSAALAKAPSAALRPSEIADLPLGEVRRACVHNLHTGDSLDAVYWESGKYAPGALAEAMRVMRDWRNGEEHAMDPRLFDILHAIRAKLEVSRPFQLISGYRSPATNAMLHAESGQVASHSQHLLGRASDVRIEGVELADLHRAALSLKAGGVGFYPVSNFVHVDVGSVRAWAGA